MDENKVYYPETIDQNPLPVTGGLVGQLAPVVSGSGNGEEKQYTTPRIDQIPFPERVYAVETIGATLNTKARKILGGFSFGKYGGIQVGEYENGVTGDIKISPNGIVARNSNGDTTFALDGETGDATFLGTIAAGSVIVGTTGIGTGSSIYLDGANNRIIVNDGSNDRVLIGKF